MSLTPARAILLLAAALLPLLACTKEQLAAATAAADLPSSGSDTPQVTIDAAAGDATGAADSGTVDVMDVPKVEDPGSPLLDVPNVPDVPDVPGVPDLQPPVDTADAASDAGSPPDLGVDVGPGPCPEDPVCADALKCADPLIALKGGVSCKCAWPNTCDCNDGTEPYTTVEPLCKEPEQVALVDSTPICVSPQTCGPSGGACTNGAECAMSVYHKPVASEADCYCLICPSTVLTLAEHQSRSAAWTQHCTQWLATATCPAVKCKAPAPPRCVFGQCATSVPECEKNEDCVMALHGAPVRSLADCTCPMCPTTPMNTTLATIHQTQWQKHCQDWSNAQPCLPPPCAFPPTPVCGDDRRCQFPNN